MKGFLFKFKNLSFVILNLLVITISSYFICQSEKFQQKISPEKYWQNKINCLNNELKRDLIKIDNLNLNLEKEIALRSYYEKLSRLKAQELGLSFSEIYNKSEKERLAKIDEIKKEINELNLEKQKIAKDLEGISCHRNIEK